MKRDFSALLVARVDSRLGHELLSQDRDHRVFTSGNELSKNLSARRVVSINQCERGDAYVAFFTERMTANTSAMINGRPAFRS